jgi:hypothetical protein
MKILFTVDEVPLDSNAQCRTLLIALFCTTDTNIPVSVGFQWVGQNSKY